MKPNSKPYDLDAFFKAVKKSHNCSRGGTKAAEKMNIMQSPSLPVFRLHHQDRKEQACK